LFILIVCGAAIAVSTPIAAASIVSIASRREDRNWSLGRPPGGRLEMLARRIVAFDADSVSWPVSKARALQEADLADHWIKPAAARPGQESEAHDAA
jgi:hypothetical protein